MLLSENAYLVLGLGTDADEKSVNKRYKEQLNILGIDEVPEYETDISFVDYKKIRTDDKIKQAFHELSNEKKKIRQVFFWFQVVDEQDELLYGKLSEGKVIDAINGWYNLYEETGKYNYLKNYIISELLCAEYSDAFPTLDFSEDWEMLAKAIDDCINEDSNFWESFEKTLDVYCDIKLTRANIGQLKKELPKIMADTLFSISEKIKDPGMYTEYNKLTKAETSAFENDSTVSNILGTISDNASKLDSDKFGEKLEKAKGNDIEYDKELSNAVKIIKNIEKDIEKLDKMGLGGSAKVNKIRDEIAKKVMAMANVLNNKLEDYPSALDFIKEAGKIAASESLKIKLNKGEETISENTKYSMGICWICKKNKSNKDCAKVFDIHKVTGRDYRIFGGNRVYFKHAELTIPCCKECHDKEIRNKRRVWLIGIPVAFLIALIVTLNSDVDSFGTGLFWYFVLFYVLPSLLICRIVNHKYNYCSSGFPLWEELKKDGREMGAQPPNTH